MKMAKCVLWNVGEKWRVRGAGLWFGGEGDSASCAAHCERATSGS